jgi:hypothetical protein
MGWLKLLRRWAFWIAINMSVGKNSHQPPKCRLNFWAAVCLQQVMSSKALLEKIKM